MNASNSRHTSPQAPPASTPSGGKGAQRPSAGETLVSRRGFLYGAIGVGAAAAVGVGAAAYMATSASSGEDVPTLKVPNDALVSLADLDVLENPDFKVQLLATHDLPYGTLVWANDGALAACLLPTETGSPLTQVGILWFGTGEVSTVLEKAVGSTEHYEVYDVRANSNGIVWTEADVLEGSWRIYSAKMENNVLGQPALMEEGGSESDTPTLAVAGDQAFWQVLPKAPATRENVSRLMQASFGSSSVSCALEAPRRMGTPVYGGEDGVTVTPRLDSPTVYYQLTHIDAKSGSVTDTLTLPQGMTPLEAGYGQHGFMFSFSNIYNYGDGISNLGTYTPYTKPAGDYDSVKWFGFARTPSAAPAWCNDLLIVKSSYSVCGVDLSEGSYFAIDVDNGADTYGDYLASTGTRDTFVTFANIDHQPVGEPAVKACRVKVWGIADPAAVGTPEGEIVA